MKISFLQDFNVVLLSTRGWLHRLITNNVLLRDLVVLPLRYFDVDAETKALSEFHEFLTSEGVTTADVGSLTALLSALNYRRNLQVFVLSADI